MAQCTPSLLRKKFIEFNESVDMTKPSDWWTVSEPKYPAIVIAPKLFIYFSATSVPNEIALSDSGLAFNKLSAIWIKVVFIWVSLMTINFFSFEMSDL